MADCAKCGAKLKEDARFCGACGSKVNEKQENEGAQMRTDNTPQEPGSTRKKKRFIAILIGACSTAVVLALIFAVGIVYGKRAQPEELRQALRYADEKAAGEDYGAAIEALQESEKAFETNKAVQKRLEKYIARWNRTLCEKMPAWEKNGQYEEAIAALRSYSNLTGDNSFSGQITQLKQLSGSLEIEEAIDAIGEVTLARETAITDARAMYEKAEHMAKAMVENYAVLEQAEADLSSLKVENACEQIDRIGEVSLESGEKIEAVEAVYERLSSEEKQRVTNYETLQKAREALTELRAKNVVDLIDQIGEVTLETGEAVKTAKEAYDALSGTEKELVTNAGKIETALDKLNELETEKRVKNILLVTELGISRPNFLNAVDLYISFKNMSDKVIKYITFEVVPYNSVGDVVSCGIRGRSKFKIGDTGPYAKGEGRNGESDAAWYNGSITEVRFASIKIEYMDETSVFLSGNELAYVFE